MALLSKNNKGLVVFRVVKNKKRENKDGVSCIIEYYYDRCLYCEKWPF